MDAFKNFLKKKKVDKHFKRTGSGKRLDPSSTGVPSIVSGSAQGGGIDRVAAADVAAQAALKRLYKAEPQISSSQKKIQMIAQRELEEERRRQQANQPDLSKLRLEEKRTGPDIREFEHADVIKAVYFTCELLGEDESMTKPDMMRAIEEFLTSQLQCEGEDTVIPAVLLLYSLNRKPAREVAVETIGKYIQNIVECPDEPKFRRIRMSNKAYQERVASAKGGPQFLHAVGFKEALQPFKEGDVPEPFLVISEDDASDTGRLVTALSMLRDGQSVPIKVSREATIYHVRENERIPMPRLPPDFFDLTAEEIQREQQNRVEEVDRMLSLRTQEMRERDEKQRQYSYKYTLVRIRFPDRYVLQGTFGCYEPLSAVREYIAKHLSNQAALFSLYNPVRGSEPLIDETKSLAALGLAPAVVLHLHWDEAVDGPSLSQEFIEAAVPLPNRRRVSPFLPRPRFLDAFLFFFAKIFHEAGEMDPKSTQDLSTLRNITGRDSSPFLLISPRPKRLVTESVQPSAVVERLCSFIPKIAAANELLARDEKDNTKRKLVIDIQKVALDIDESDTSSSEEDGISEDDIESETEPGEHVEFDLSFFREQPTSASTSDKGIEFPQEVEILPEAFREAQKSNSNDQAVEEPKRLIEEM